MDTNVVILKGRAVADATYTVLPTSGKGVTEFRVAVRINPSTTEYHIVKVWGSRAEETARRVHRGDTVLIEGTLRAQPYTTKGGEKRVSNWVSAGRVLVATLSGEVPDAPTSDDEPPF